jgi:hypothetical protein
MIISKLQGGLANQIFQWAIARNLSIEYNKPFYLDLNFYNNQINVTKRNFSLNKFKKIHFNIYNNLDENVFSRLEDNFYYKEIICDENTNYYLDGYWQSEKYFKKNQKIIREDLSIDEKQKTEILLKYPQLLLNTISLHIRRTDYVSSNGFHPLCTISYYQNAINIINNYDYIFVFSDDINWCKLNLNFPNMIFVENQGEIDDLYMMSLCKNNIISNSSFSWWGAWLNENGDKKIFYPRKWFGEFTNINTLDICPNDWVGL